ncbi:LysR family transcriptional regulator [Hydrogenophaga crassostreae]|uniref:LysR family transcriptional regulator n=1 Tax=Hydrogenophaga crassostreae TaxID=1763535 RepID=A0A162W6S1_9BURK|nr:LysR substrate-binding domain-containing protein [Hydrogenophaga crassostreae]AOW15672.1 LysR family transcriptional regulator [Hydrogenophaga crassostreae]OAD44336.1 LysR family transcriptional regulator [Hydrogenophaga crassostreae]
MHFDLVDLRLIVRVAELNSLTRGAERSHISLAAASTRIKNLEESVGAKLLVRSSQGMTLTQPGKTFVQHAMVVLGQIENLRGDMQEYADGIKGQLRIFSNTTALCEFLPPVLGSFLQSHPDINIHLREMLSHDIVRAVLDGYADIGVVAGTVNTENLEIIPYRSDQLVLVVPANHFLAQRTSIRFSETLDLVHVGLHEASALHGFLKQICDDMHSQLQLRIQVGNFQAACRMIEAQAGVGILPKSAVHLHAASMDIKIIPLDDTWADRHMHVCIRHLETMPAFARDLVAMLQADAENASRVS